MRKHTRRSVFVTMLVAGSAMLSSSAAAQQEMQQVPQQLQPPAGEGLLLRVHAKGDQIYTCKGDAAQFTWVLKAPEAQLFDKDGNPSANILPGHHGKPTMAAV